VAWDDQWVERQWPQETGLVLASTGTVAGKVTVKLNPQLRQRRVTVTSELLKGAATIQLHFVWGGRGVGQHTPQRMTLTVLPPWS
jgi:hypothetical protein